MTYVADHTPYREHVAARPVAGHSISVEDLQRNLNQVWLIAFHGLSEQNIQATRSILFMHEYHTQDHLKDFSVEYVTRKSKSMMLMVSPSYDSFDARIGTAEGHE